MKVTGWTSWDDPDYKEMFPRGSKWIWDYDDVEDVVANEIRKQGYKISGFLHKNKEFCTPIIDGKYKFNVSEHLWDTIMVKVLNPNG